MKLRTLMILVVIGIAISFSFTRKSALDDKPWFYIYAPVPGSPNVLYISGAVKKESYCNDETYKAACWKKRFAESIKAQENQNISVGLISYDDADDQEACQRKITDKINNYSGNGPNKYNIVRVGF